MSQRERLVLAPQYAFRFSCIGPECEDTCCQGWHVSVDEPTYKAYRRVRHPDLRPLLDESVKRNRSNPGPANYAKIKLNGEGVCPLLSAEGLCTVQRDLGEDYLSTTCAVYPRISHVVDGVLERALTLSCPEAARLALLNDDPMEFDQILEQSGGRDSPAKNVDTRSRGIRSQKERHFWDLRQFTIGLLQNRSYDVWERLVILGLFIQKVEEAQNGQSKGIPMLVNSYSELLNDHSLKESLAHIPTQATIQFKLAKELIDERFQQSITVKQYLACMNQFLNGIRFTKDSSVSEIGVRYQHAYKEYYAPFILEREYLLENYLVNHVFKNLFPLGERGMFGEYVMLVIHYAMIKMHLIGMAAYHEGLNEDLVVKLIYSFARVVEHNPAYLNRIYSLLKESDMATMPYMAILIKN